MDCPGYDAQFMRAYYKIYYFILGQSSMTYHGPDIDCTCSRYHSNDISTAQQICDGPNRSLHLKSKNKILLITLELNEKVQLSV